MIINMEGAYMNQEGHRTLYTKFTEEFMCVIRQILLFLFFKGYMHIKEYILIIFT